MSPAELSDWRRWGEGGVGAKPYGGEKARFSKNHSILSEQNSNIVDNKYFLNSLLFKVPPSPYLPGIDLLYKICNPVFVRSVLLAGLAGLSKNSNIFSPVKFFAGKFLTPSRHHCSNSLCAHCQKNFATLSITTSNQIKIIYLPQRIRYIFYICFMIKIHDIRHLIAIKGKIARIKIVKIKIADGKPGYWANCSFLSLVTDEMRWNFELKREGSMRSFITDMGFSRGE